MAPMQNPFAPRIPMPEIPLSIEVEYKAKPSFPIKASPSPEGTVGADIQSPEYAAEQHDTWQALFSKHHSLAHGPHFLCEEYLDGLRILDFPTDKVPSLGTMSSRLEATCGWRIIRVAGLVPPEKFFPLLANRVFPCTDFIRHKDELDYTPAPDLFHDQVGHLPMLTHQRFASFFHLFGLAGCAARTEEHMMWFNRIYWFTTEFGLLNPTTHQKQARDKDKTKIYGAGISSSCGEILYSLSDKVKKHPFDLEHMIQTDFDIYHMQDTLFEIESFDELEEKFKTWARKHQFLKEGSV